MTTRPAFRVFLSAVTGEFGLARSAVASDLRAFQKGLAVSPARGYPPDQAASARDSPELAARFLAWLKGQGLNRSYFAGRDELRALVLREDWPSTAARRVVHLPYPSLGTLF